MNLKGIFTGILGVGFLILLAFLFVKFTGIGATYIYQNTGWNLTGNADKKYMEEMHHEIDELNSKMKNYPQTTFALDSQAYNFGTISADKTVSHTFKIKNTGTNPLIIGDVKVGCGCTVANFTKSPIQPSQEGELSIEFDPAGKDGHQQKNMMLYVNAPESPYPFHFTADVKK